MNAVNATINVRLSDSLKKRGDDVLKKNEISPTQAVRALWQLMASTKRVPDFIIDSISKPQDAEIKRKREALANLKGSTNSFSGLTDAELDALRLKGLMEKYESLQ